ncbi:MAG: hypothetical protein O2931_06730 [Planctomycetota bacterium]|nr:hypothetical protein [Planctomycetota bacterium]MDA1178474.1 hypothetical protein [Planctomycetota bacterium]
MSRRNFGMIVFGSLAALGLSLIVASFVFSGPRFSAPSWSPADAEGMIKTALEAKALAQQKAFGKPISEQQVQQALANHQVYCDRLDQVVQRGHTMILAMRWCGVGMTLIALITYAYSNR